jgi:predicted amidohydrolase YtcJ
MTSRRPDAPRARLLHGARLLRPQPAPPTADAVAVIDDRIVAVGPRAECAAALPTDHDAVDLGGRVLAPGFVDAHLHPMIMCVFEQQLRFDDCTSLGEVLELVADRARDTEGDRAVVGFQLDDARLDERRLPTAAELDRATGGHPVVLIRRDGHHAVGSTSALTAAGLDDPGSDPPGGRVERDATGRPTGLVRETAVSPLLALLPEVTLDDLQAGLASWVDRLLRQGITAISAMCQTTDEGPSGPAGALEALGWSVLVDQVPFDVQTILIAPDPTTIDEVRATSPLHDPAARRRVDGVKLFLDGTLGGCTACMHAPFADRPGTSGMRTMDDDDAYDRMVAAHLGGHQVCIHAIGDDATAAATALFARLLAEHPGDHRHRIEHASVLDPATIDLLADLGITTVVQPINLRSERHWLAERLGPDRLGRTYPFRSLLDAGVTVAGSSDAPIEHTDVLAAMAAAVDRGGLSDDQAVTPEEALEMYTIAGSWARRTEDDLGAILPGRRADLVVLSDDPTTTTAAVEVLATVIGGVDRHPDDGLATIGLRTAHP